MKTNLDKFFKADKNLQEQGVDFVIQQKTDKEPEISFRVRHITQTNPRIKQAFTQYYKPFAKQVELGTLPAEKEAEIQQRIFIDTALVAWKGVDIDGKPAECNKDNALKLFKQLPELFQKLWEYASDFTSFKEEVGNS